MEGGAVFSKNRRYRYSLWRIWEKERPKILFVCLNPSTADETHNDPTVRRCVNFARDWGYGQVCVSNIFAFRGTKPAQLYTASDPVGPGNDLMIKADAIRCDQVVFAWGNHGRLMRRGREVSLMIGTGWCFGVTKTGEPKHPLYQRRDAELVSYGGTWPEYRSKEWLENEKTEATDPDWFKKRYMGELIHEDN